MKDTQEPPKSKEAVTPTQPKAQPAPLSPSAVAAIQGKTAPQAVTPKPQAKVDPVISEKTAPNPNPQPAPLSSSAVAAIQDKNVGNVTPKVAAPKTVHQVSPVVSDETPVSPQKSGPAPLSPSAVAAIQGKNAGKAAPQVGTPKPPAKIDPAISEKTTPVNPTPKPATLSPSAVAAIQGKNAGKATPQVGAPKTAPQVSPAAPDVMPMATQNPKPATLGQSNGTAPLGVNETETAIIIGDPDGWKKFNHKQGDNDQGACGTCGLVSTEQILNRFGKNITENEIVHCAIKNELGDFKPETSPRYKGGTIPEELAKILKVNGVPAQVKDGASIDDLARFVEDRRGIIIAVNSATLWDQMYDSSDGDADHAIIVTGLKRTRDTGKILGFYINDSGDIPPKSGRFVSADKMQEMWTQSTGRFGYGNCVITDNSVPGT